MNTAFLTAFTVGCAPMKTECEFCPNTAVEEVKFNGQYIWVCDPHAVIIQNHTPNTMYAKRLREGGDNG